MNIEKKLNKFFRYKYDILYRKYDYTVVIKNTVKVNDLQKLRTYINLMEFDVRNIIVDGE